MSLNSDIPEHKDPQGIQFRLLVTNPAGWRST